MDEFGNSVPFEVVEWLIRLAHENHEPIDSPNLALKYRQGLLMAAGDEEFQLEPAPTYHGQIVNPPDPIKLLRARFDPVKIKEEFDALMSNPNYVVNGKLVEHQRALLAEEWRESIGIAMKLKEMLGL